MTAQGTGTRERLWSQVAATVVMSQSQWIYGTFICLGGQLIAESQSADPARLSVADATLVASIAQAGRVIGCMLSAQLTDRLGILRVIQMGTPLNLLAWPLMTLTSGRLTMIAGSVLVGAFVGLNAFGGRLYIAEVSSVQRRATLCYLPNISLGLSLLACFSLSAAIPWRHAILICGCLPSVMHFFGATLLPNSPRWLLHHGAPEDQARKSIAFYRGPHVDISKELRDIRLSLKGSKDLNILRQARLLVTDWSVAKPCLLLLIQYAFDIFCGGIVLTQYAPGIFQTVVASLSATQCSQLLAALQVCGLLCSATLLRWWGRRTVLMAAGALATTGMLTVAAFFYFEETLGDHTWLVLVGVVLANAASSGGVSPLCHLLCGELLPLSVRPLFGNALSLYLGGLAFVFVHLFPVLKSELGSAGLFGCLAGVNVLLILHASCLLPETRGLSLEQVQLRHFSSKKKTVRSGDDAEKEGNKTRTWREEGDLETGRAEDGVTYKTEVSKMEEGSVSYHKQTVAKSSQGEEGKVCQIHTNTDAHKDQTEQDEESGTQTEMNTQNSPTAEEAEVSGVHSKIDNIQIIPAEETEMSTTQSEVILGGVKGQDAVTSTQSETRHQSGGEVCAPGGKCEAEAAARDAHRAASDEPAVSTTRATS